MSAFGEGNKMSLDISADLLAQIHANATAAYPEEGAGFLLGTVQGDRRQVISVLSISNAREDSARHKRYLLTAQDYLRGEQEAARLGLDLLGIFHSHPDHPNLPSDYDREWAMPWFSYVITNVISGRAVESRAWRLEEDRSAFFEEEIELSIQSPTINGND
jgi:proteasome lid subunit RPN8/RPN11